MKSIYLALGLIILASSACRKALTPAAPFHLREQTGIDFSNELLESDSFNIIKYLYYYNGGGIAAGDLNNDGLPDLFFTGNETSNRLYLNQGDFQFKDITETAGVGTSREWSTGVTMVDINSDGWLDIYVCQLGDYKGKQGRNRLYINQGATEGGIPAFREAAGEYGLDFSGFATQAAFFDYDLDGDLDVYLLNHSVHSVGNYGKAANLRPQRDSLAGDRLLRNDLVFSGARPAGKFTDVSEKAGILASRIGYGLGIAVGDVNSDGWPDIFISNDFHENDYLYFNNGDGTFSEGIEQTMSYTSHFSMGNAIADWNNDDLPDIISLDMKPEEEEVVRNTVGSDSYNIFLLKRSFGYYAQFSHNMLQLNRGNTGGQLPVFSEVARIAGIDATDWSWAPLVSDLDNDGWKDIYITNGIWRRPNDLDYLKYISNREIQAVAPDKVLIEKMPSGKVRNYAFKNRGGLAFDNVSASWGLNHYGVSNGAALADLDNDGDLDVVVNNLNEKASVYENGFSENNFIKIRLRGKGQNTFGIGAKVTVRTGALDQRQELFTSRGYLSSLPTELVFGLGRAAVIDRIEVHWPEGGKSILETIPANQILEITQPDPPADLPPVPVKPTAQAEPADKFGLNFVHRENTFIDFNEEPLIPHLLSTQGPHMAVADVNGDGLDDLYICGAKGQSGQLFYQTSSGEFRVAPDFFGQNAQGEEVDALFFDADNDGDFDLYVVNGGGETDLPSSAFLDRLYFNDGAGNFSWQEDAVEPVLANGSCVAALDFNQDGAQDLFVGARSIPGNYGHAPESTLLENNGRGRFTQVTAEHLPNEGKLGMVTDAAFLEGEKEPTLVVVGEWMPVQLLRIREKRWKEETLPESSGWWNRIALADCNGDGRQDLILGNWGLNNAFEASPEKPLSLYVKDFDGNFKTDPLLTYFREGKEYPLVSIDELMKQMPELRQSMGTYADFAKLGFSEIFPSVSDRNAIVRKAETLASGIALSEGKTAYQLKPFPEMAQLSPVFAIDTEDLNGDGHLDILLAGNFYGSRSDMGIYDASSGMVLTGNGNGGFQMSVGATEPFLQIRGEVRDIRLIRHLDRSLLLIARNDQPLRVLELEQLTTALTE